MTVQALKPVTADEFLDWATDRQGPRYELFRGRPVQMAPERAAHADAKLNLAIALRMAARGTDAHVYPDGMSVVVDSGNVFEPDTLVRLGGPLPGDTVKVTDPIIIGEILSPSTSRIDVTAKLVGYFTISSLHHYLVVDAKAHTLTHYHRDATGEVIGNVISEGILMLDPPGLSFDVGQVSKDCATKLAGQSDPGDQAPPDICCERIAARSAVLADHPTNHPTVPTAQTWNGGEN